MPRPHFVAASHRNDPSSRGCLSNRSADGPCVVRVQPGEPAPRFGDRGLTRPDRVVVGVRSERDAERVRSLLAPFGQRIDVVRVESAELSKHALNAYLATSIVFINEIARLAELTGADTGEVERALKSDQRIGPRAYLRPGAPTRRDIGPRCQLSDRTRQRGGLRDAIATRRSHEQRPSSRVDVRCAASPARDLQRHTHRDPRPHLQAWNRHPAPVWSRGALHAAGRRGRQGRRLRPGYQDPSPRPFSLVRLGTSPRDIVRTSVAAVVATEWPEFRSLTSEDFLDGRPSVAVVDPGGFLAEMLAGDERIQYLEGSGACLDSAGSTRARDPRRSARNV